MPQVRYKIYTLSASALMAYAQEDAESGYAFALNAKATEKCKVLTAYENWAVPVEQTVRL